jgi:hypothetical protein
LELLRDILGRAVEDINQFPGQTSVLVGDKERHCETFLTGTSGTANTVNVAIHLLGKIKVYYNTDIVTVER